MRRASGSGPTCTVAVLVGIGAFACGGGVDDPRAAAVVNAMVASDINLIRTRPQLVPGK